MTAPATLAAALAAVQANLPEVAKGETATVPTKTGGTYKYSYADLAAVTRVILPRLGAVGLSWTTKPTILDGRFVLEYKLLHTSGEAETGCYPLPDRGSPQEIGSAITYARRYALCSVTGVAPDDDDDAAEASRGSRDYSRPGGRDSWDDARPARRPEPAPVSGPPAADRPVSGPPAALSVAATELLADLKGTKDEPGFGLVWKAAGEAAKAGRISPAELEHFRTQWKAHKAALFPPEPKNPGNDPHRRRMFALLGQAEITDRDDRLHYVSEVAGREVASTNDLTDDEVQLVNERLESYIKQNTPAGDVAS
ncbi:ERF family protein [Micromonospora taraxaci]|uniref:ERF family protein n=1 Tax=Micromonospora taraxaci TaxID=1316803 RepID=UPI003404D646